MRAIRATPVWPLPFLLLLGLLLGLSARPLQATEGIFRTPEPTIHSSPSTPLAYVLPPGESAVDLDVSRVTSDAVLITKRADGRHRIVFWRLDRETPPETPRGWEVPPGLALTAVAWHPTDATIFLLGHRREQYELLKADSGATTWRAITIYRSARPLRRLVVGPRPYQIGYDPKTNRHRTSHRLFFGVQRADRRYSIHSVTTEGSREYVVTNAQGLTQHLQGAEAPPEVLVVPSALPVGFHPAGHLLIWEQSETHCLQKARYARDNWAGTAALTPNPLCTGSATYTPNGAALLYWRTGVPGVTLLQDRGTQSTSLAEAYTFAFTPSSTADGKGIVGAVNTSTGTVIQFIPIEVPLADVANAWMFLESPGDRTLLTAQTGLFRQLDYAQLYELFDSEAYYCNAYDESTPARPYLVSTDVFWEMYAAAFEGLFVLSERQVAMPAFWTFVEHANSALRTAAPNSRMARAFAALSAVRSARMGQDPEADHILRAADTAVSTVTGKPFAYGDLTPRSHYTADPALATYFKASKYLMQLELLPADGVTLGSLPEAVQRAALTWITAYAPFVAPAKRPLVWRGSTAALADYSSHPETDPQIFPLAWGFDNEVLDNTVFHRDWPPAQQIIGPDGPRLLPSGLDVAAVLGSLLAESILSASGEFARFPNLQPQLAELQQRYAKAKDAGTVPGSLYHRWLLALGTQWAANIISPGQVMDERFWHTKRLQTGLASWATLRHATVLVNARVGAECGEAGFEPIVLAPPRGYVEPDPATFDAIAGLFDATVEWVRAAGQSWTGSVPATNELAKPEAVRQGVLRRLADTRDKARLFRDIAQKELQGLPLTEHEYEEILYVGRVAEHNFLVFKSLAQQEFALSTPDPMAKIADVAAASGTLLLVGVGAPLEWDQLVPFFGRRQVVKGVAYSYYEFRNPEPLSDAHWRERLQTQARPDWIAPSISPEKLSCPPREP